MDRLITKINKTKIAFFFKNTEKPKLLSNALTNSQIGDSVWSNMFDKSI